MGQPPTNAAARARPKFVIHTPSFSETNGGAIVLHLLCHRLREQGEQALLWPRDRPLPRLGGNPRRFLGALRYALTRRARRFSTGPFPNRLARRRDLGDAIVVYPEVVSGNPLGGRQVVRWLLHKPGYHSGGVIDYGRDDLYFFVVDAYNDPALNPDLENKLDLVWFHEAYRDEGRPHREGSCYMMRKGEGREISHDLRDSVRLDGMPHEAIADQFNRRKYFYCYDIYTMYTLYAAICGCIPVIMPEPGLSKTDWRPCEDTRYGLAYGTDDVDWAVATRGKMLEMLRHRREEEDRMLRRFVRKCVERYGAGASGARSPQRGSSER
jgi:hypothetical protein